MRCPTNWRRTRATSVQSCRLRCLVGHRGRLSLTAWHLVQLRRWHSTMGGVPRLCENGMATKGPSGALHQQQQKWRRSVRQLCGQPTCHHTLSGSRRHTWSRGSTITACFLQHSNTNRANSDRANSNSSSSSSSRGDTSRTCSGLGGSLNGQWDRHRRWFTTECRCQCTGARPTPVKQGQPCRLRCSLLHRGRPSPRSRRSVTLVAACLSLPSQQVPCTRPWS